MGGVGRAVWANNSGRRKACDSPQALVGALHVEMALLLLRVGVLLGGAERVDRRTLNHTVRRSREGACGAIQVTLGRVDMCVVERASALRAIIALPVAATCALVMQRAGTF